MKAAEEGSYTLRKQLFVAVAQCALAASACGQAAIATVDIPPPFAPTSVWNIGVGSGAQWGSPSDPDVQQLRSLTGVVNAAAYGMPIYSGGSGDPLVTVTDADPGNLAIPPQSIHVPIGAKPAEGTDRHMAFYDAMQPGWLWSYFGCAFNNGSDVTRGIACQMGGKWDTTGNGVTNGLAPGSDYNFAVGTITDYDLAQGVIRHAVRFALSTDVLKSPGPTWTDNIPWPNTHEDYYGPSLYTGRIVAGVTIGIPADVDLNSLSLTQGGMMLAQALQNYGAIWRDSCGSRVICFYSTPESDGNSLIQGMRADLAKIVPLLTIMRNQGPNSVNGGGASIRRHKGRPIPRPTSPRNERQSTPKSER